MYKCSTLLSYSTELLIFPPLSSSGNLINILQVLWKRNNGNGTVGTFSNRRKVSEAVQNSIVFKKREKIVPSVVSNKYFVSKKMHWFLQRNISWLNCWLHQNNTHTHQFHTIHTHRCCPSILASVFYLDFFGVNKVMWVHGNIWNNDNKLNQRC